MKELVSKMFDFLEKAPTDKEYTTAEVVKTVAPSHSFEMEELLELDATLRNSAKKRNLTLDSFKYRDMIIGLTYNIPFSIHKIK